MTPTKTLAETVDLMLSKDADDQLKAEYYQLENRFITLNEMLTEWDVGRLDPVPVGSRYTYGEQLGYMRSYLQAMKKIAAARGIDLSGNTKTEESGDDYSAGTE